MKPLVYQVSKVKGNVKVERSDGVSLVRPDESILDAFLLTPEDKEQYVQFLWDLDEDIAHALSKVPEDICIKLRDFKKAYVRPYPMFYIKEKVFSVKKGRDSADLFHLKQYFEESNPKSLEEKQALAQELCDGVDKLRINPPRYTSPARMMQDCYLCHLDLPEALDGSIPEEVLEWAYMSAGRLWTEAHQLGHFEKVYDYDITSAFPSEAKTLVDPRYCEWKQSTDKVYWEADYGWVKGRVKIPRKTMISPIIYLDEDGKRSNRVGEWDDILPLPWVKYILEHGGDFRVDRGWYGIAKRKIYPMTATMDRLYNARQLGGIAKQLAKGMANAFYGLTLQYNEDGTFGKYFMPPWGSYISAIPPLKVADFIQKYDLDPIHITVDGVACQQEVALSGNGMGHWRLDSTDPMLVIGSGTLFSGEKHPESIYYDEILNMIQKKPQASEYHKPKKTVVTLGKMKDYGHNYLGRAIRGSSSVSIEIERDRIFEPDPRCGRDILERVCRSKPRSIKEKDGDL